MVIEFASVKGPSKLLIPREKLARLAGFEPATQGLGIPCSIYKQTSSHFTIFNKK